ncbi:MAG TPA: signal peptidase I [Coriobacteriia bacterium]
MTPEVTTKPVDENPESTAPKTQSAGRQIAEFLVTLAIAFAVAQAVRTWVIQPFVVPTGSMLPTIQLSDQVLANKFILRFRPPVRGDIVVLDDPTGQVGTLIKRVIATGGQTVDIRDGKVWIDGTALVEPYTHGQPNELGPLPMPYKIPADSVWVMGDNRTQSQDSRWFGAVSLSAVHGKAFFIYWPWARIGDLR